MRERPDTLRVGMPMRPPLLTRDNGPGVRWVLYLQGCRHPCTTECLNPDLLDPAGGHDESLDDLRLLVDQVAAGRWGPVEGVTILGGEPSDQAVALYGLLSAIRQRGLSVVMYSGHPLAWFRAPGHAAEARLLEVTDILVDGPFLPHLADANLRWRGSSNQSVRRLTDRYSDSDIVDAMTNRGVTVALRADGIVSVSGLQDRATAEAVAARLRASIR